MVTIIRVSKRSTNFILFFLLINIIQVNAQEVFGNAGSNFENGNGISYTIGEAIIFTFNNNSIICTQGFHQTGNDIINKCDDQLIGEVSVFPNPAKGLLHIISQVSIPYYLYNSLGKKVIGGNLTEYNNTIDVSSLPSGLYFLDYSVSCKTKVEKIIIENE